jgi:hypothetical protein
MGYTGHYLSDTAIDNWPSGTTAADKEAAIQLEAKAEKALNWSPYPKPFMIRMNGSGRNRLTLPLPAKIITVSEIQIYGVILEPSWWAFDGSSVFLYIYSSGATGATPELLAIMNELAQGGGIFPRGLANIQIKGTMGEAAVPAWAKELVRILIRAANDPSLYTLYSPGNESIGNYSYSLRPDKENESRRKTGIQEADDLIWLFRRKRPILRA